jgi:hypothetical protein
VPTSGDLRRVAFATNREFPESPPDDRLAFAELERRGIEAVPAIWDSDSVDWASFEMVVLRSTWGYQWNLDGFLAWCTSVSALAPVWNPLSIVRWNAHKGYLVDLAKQGFDVVPTEVVRRSNPETLRSVIERRGWTDTVVKPAVGADGLGLSIAREGERDSGETALEKLLRAGDALVQPYLGSAKSRGERSLVFFDGRFAFAAEYPYVLERMPREARKVVPEPRQLDQAQRILRSLGEPTLYARFDFLPLDEGGWTLGELELIEPELLLRGDPTAPARFAEAIARRFEGTAPR